MSSLLSPSEVEELAKKAGLPMYEVCRRAGIAQSTFTRWKNGSTTPGMGVYERLRDVVKDAAAGSGV